MVHIVDDLINYGILVFLVHWCWKYEFRKGWMPKAISICFPFIAGIYSMVSNSELFIVNMLWVVLSLCVLFRENELYMTMLSVVLMVFTGMVDTFSLIFVRIVFFGGYNYTDELTWWKETAYIFSMMIYMSAYIFILKKNQIYLKDIKLRYRLSLFFVTLIFEFVVVYVFSVFYEQGEEYAWYIHLRFFLCLMGALNAIFITLELAVKNKQLDIQKENLSMALQMVRDQYDYQKANSLKIQSFRHDIKNHVGILKELILGKKYGDAETYISQICEETERLSPHIKTGDDFLDSVCNHFYYLCGVEDIKFDVCGRLSKPLDISMMDATTLFGNALQNAYEATKKTKNPFIRMEIVEHTKEVFISLSNSFRKTNHTFSFATIKENKEEHGFGLKNIKNVIEKYNGEYYVSIKEGEDESVFLIEFSVPKGD